MDIVSCICTSNALVEDYFRQLPRGDKTKHNNSTEEDNDKIIIIFYYSVTVQPLVKDISCVIIKRMEREPNKHI